MISSKYPDTFRSMVLLDPVMFPRPLLLMLFVTKKLGLTSLIHPYVKPTLRRRNGWSDKKEAFNYFHNRKIFRNWTDEGKMVVLILFLAAIHSWRRNGLVLCHRISGHRLRN